MNSDAENLIPHSDANHAVISGLENSIANKIMDYGHYPVCGPVSIAIIEMQLRLMKYSLLNTTPKGVDALFMSTVGRAVDACVNKLAPGPKQAMIDVTTINRNHYTARN